MKSLIEARMAKVLYFAEHGKVDPHDIFIDYFLIHFLPSWLIMDTGLAELIHLLLLHGALAL